MIVKTSTARYANKKNSLCKLCRMCKILRLYELQVTARLPKSGLTGFPSILARDLPVP
jgi:hypothetical protein